MPGKGVGKKDFTLTVDEKQTSLTAEPRPRCPWRRNSDRRSGISAKTLKYFLKSSEVTENVRKCLTFWGAHFDLNLRLKRRDDLVLLPQKAHQAVVLFARTGGQRGGTRAGQGVVLVTDRHTGNLSGMTRVQKQ